VCIRRIDAADQHVHAVRTRAIDEFLQQDPPVTVPAMRVVDVDRVLHRVLVSRPRAERAVAREAEQFAFAGLEADDRMAARALGAEPGGHAVERARPVVVQRGGVHDRFVQDVEDRTRVALDGAGDQVHGHVRIPDVGRIALEP